MNKIAVTYKSKYGSTKKYAEWISQKLGADLFDSSKVSYDKLLEYDTIVYGGGLYAGGISGISLITKNFDKLKDKNLVIFTVGLSPTEDPNLFKPLIEKNLTEVMRQRIKVFNLRGGMDYKKLNLIHKPMMAMLMKIIGKKSPEELTTDEKAMLEVKNEKADFTDINTIEPLTSYVASLNK